MSDTKTEAVVRVVPGGVGIGVWWFVWGAKGFWWGVLYGIGWPVWAGYHLAAFLTK